MKARLKGSNDEFKEVISLKRNLVELSDAHVYHIHRLEFEPDRWQEPCKLNPEKDLSNPIDHWQDVRERAAIAAMQGTITILSNSDRYAFSEIVVEGYRGKEKTYPKEIAEFAVACADALVEKLKGE